MPRNRRIPALGRTCDQETFPRLFDGTQKVVVYWRTSADTVTIVGYYDTVSAANAAAVAAKTAAGAYPTVSINWWHSDIYRRSVGPFSHPQAETDYPAWIDESPGGR